MSRIWNHLARLVAAGLCTVLPSSVGCAQPASPSVPGVEPIVRDESLFAPLTPPVDFDSEKARLSLGEIPGHPPAPPSSPPTPDDPLPPNAALAFNEARALLSQNRYAEAIGQLEKVLGHVPRHVESHRLLAMTSLLSGDDDQARSSAEHVLTSRPDDLTSHYVLGRLAEKAGQLETARQRYRLALLCPITENKADSLVLVHYRLGLLLDRENYCAAAIDQLDAFERGLDALGDRVADNRELEMVARLHRGSVAARKAHHHALLGQYDRAADALAVALRESPGDRDFQRGRVLMLGRAGRYHEAIPLAHQLVQDSQAKDLELVGLLLAAYRLDGQADEAVRIAGELLADRPDDLQLGLLRVNALVAASRTDEAFTALRSMIEAHPGEAGLRWRLIALHRQAESWRPWFEAVVDEMTSEPVPYERIGRELDLISGSVAAAIIELRGASPPDRDEEPVRLSAGDYLLARLLERQGKAEQAHEVYERAAERTPAFEPTTVGLCTSYLSSCRWRDALDALHHAASARSEPSSLLEQLMGRCHDGLDEHEQAVAHYNRAVEIDSSNVQAIILLGKLQERREEWRQARQQYQSAVATDKDNVEARELFIRALLASAGDQDAPSGRLPVELLEMQKRAPQAPATIRCTALMTFLKDHDQEGYLDSLRRLVRQHPDDQRSRLELAATASAFRLYDEARAQLTLVLERDPHHPDAGKLLAEVLSRLLLFDEAGRQYERLLQCHPNREPWIQDYARMLTAEQDFVAAAEQWARLLELHEKDPPGTKWSLRVGLLKSHVLAERFDVARDLADLWLDEVEQEGSSDSPLLTGYRRLVLAVDQAAGEHDAYLSRCREWLAEAPGHREIREWLIGARRGGSLVAPGGPTGKSGLIGAGRHDEAALQVLAWLGEEPDDPLMVDWLIDVLQSAGRHDEAVELAGSILATAQGQRRQGARIYMQAICTRARRYEQAIDFAQAWMEDTMRVYRAARPEFQEELKHDIVDQKKTIASLMSQTCRFDEAVSRLESLRDEVETDAERVEILRTLSFVHQRQQRPDLSEQRLREAYRLMPDDIGVNNDLGYTLAEAGHDLEEAERMTRLAVGERPDIAAYLDSLGWVLYKRGRLEDARLWLQRAARLPQGRDPVVVDHLGDALWRLGNMEAAVSGWQEALTIYREQWREGYAETDEKLEAGISAKLEAAAAGRSPELAPLGTQPATE